MTGFWLSRPVFLMWMNFFDILHEEPLDRWYEPGSVITIVDANLEEEMSEEENYILASEAASAGKMFSAK